MIASLARLLAVGVAIASGSSSAAATPTITFPNGATIFGTTQVNVVGGSVNVFRGIPYAEPPVGERRWKPSTFKPISGNINATSYGSACVSSKGVGSEDCLFLNVFAPPGMTPKSKLPVMVWIHGGGFVDGSSNDFDGANLLGAASNKIVYVSLNYRLGVFGFLSNKAILKEGGGANFGLQDQEIAFAWVKKYIEHFGGNPDDITAFGESVGSMSIGMHMLARDGDQKLFKRGIMQSGGYTTSHDTVTPAMQENQTLTIAKGVGCDSDPDVLACLRRANASAVFKYGAPLTWFATVDGVYMKEMPIQRLLAGKFSRVPTIIGANRDEGWIFATGDASDASKYDSFVRSRFSRLTEAEFVRLSELYPASGFLTARHRSSEMFADSIFVCPSEQFSQSLAKAFRTHRYYFNFTSNELGYPLVIHQQDIAYVFNQVENVPQDNDNKRVVNHFQTYWTNFATTGSPNGNNLQQATKLLWPEFDSSKKQLVIQPDLTIETNGVSIPGHAERCAFWVDVEKRIASQVAFV